MIYPLGEYLIFGLGLYSLVIGSGQRSRMFWGGVCVAWLIGFLLEILFPWEGAYHWHFSRAFVLTFFAAIAWKKTPGRKILPLLITAFALSSQNLFAVNEPGIIKGEQWIFGAIVLLMASIATQDFWGMGLALAGGILLDLGISVFLFQGIVRHYDLPDPFYWNLSVVSLTAFAAVRVLWKKEKMY